MEEHSNNQQDIFCISKQLLKQNVDMKLPSYHNNHDLDNYFGKFFALIFDRNLKIKNIPVNFMAIPIYLLNYFNIYSQHLRNLLTMTFELLS